MDKHTLKIIHHESFLQLSSGALIDLLARDSFYALEIEIFQAVQLWVTVNPGAEVHEVLGKNIYIFFIHVYYK
jgi:BTB/POZ domain-containing protein 9